MKFQCGPASTLGGLHQSVVPISLYEQPRRSAMGSAGTMIVDRCRRLGMEPSARSWDFLSLALSAVTADAGLSRQTSADGWTRELELTVSVNDPVFWNAQSVEIYRLLSFLTGDIWHVDFSADGLIPPTLKKRVARPENAVTLLSGGLDSLIGSIDNAANGVNLVAVSQVATGDKAEQVTLARQVGGGLFHVQLNHNARPPESVERSQRARSLAFIAFGVLAGTALDRYQAGEPITLYVPENGFISLNIPLTSARLGSLSTRTTHPIYVRRLQALLEAAGLRIKIVNPYQFKTKGEMLRECKDQNLLKRLAASTTSCGRYARNGFEHCGRCVPCLIRRAAFHHWGQPDRTRYKYANLSRPDASHRYFGDVRAAGIAVERVRQLGFDRWTAGSLSTTQLGDISSYQEVAQRGLTELGAFLSAVGAL